MKKVLLARISNRNLGDICIYENTKASLEKFNIKVLDLPMNKLELTPIKYADAIVFVGGGIIKYVYEDFWLWISEIVEEANKYNVPVFFNAVGVECYEEENERCQILKKAINMDCVKGITVRDDVDTLKKHYIYNPNIEILDVFDPAVFTNKLYNLKSNNRSSNIIGLGIAREGLFTRNGILTVDGEFLLNFWDQLIKKIETAGYEYEIFTTGLNSDLKFINKFLEDTGREKTAVHLVQTYQLVREMTKYKGVVACRMHANIISYSVGVPSVGLVWNNKLKQWGEKINYPERFIEVDNLNADYVFEQLERAIAGGVKKNKRLLREQSFKKPLYRFIKKYVSQGLFDKKPVNQYNQRIAATGMGAIDWKYKTPNVLEALDNCLNSGIELLEIDVRLTKDDKAVCVNSWSKKKLEILGRGGRTEDWDESGITEEEFLKGKYCDSFTTINFDSAISRLKKSLKSKNYKIILDLGKPSDEKRTILYNLIFESLNKHKIPKKCFYILLRRKKDIGPAKEQLKGCNYIYKMPEYINEEGQPDDEKINKTIKLCKKNKIKIVAFSRKEISCDIVNRLREEGIKSLVFSAESLEELLKYLDMKVDIVASHFYQADYINALLGKDKS